MPVKLYQRPSGIYHLRGTVQGVRVDQSARTSDRREAEALRAKVEADLFKRAVYGDKAVATFDEAVEVYLNAGGSPDHLEPIMDRIGHRRLSEIKQPVIDSLAKELKPKASAATRVRQIYTPILAVMNAAAGAGLCDQIRVKKPKVVGGRTAYLTPQEAEDWLDALPAHLRRVVTFYLGTGCRATEGLSLIWRDVTLGERRAVFWDDQTKGGYARGVDLGRRVRAELPQRPKKADAFVFANSRGEPWHAYDAVNLMLKRIRERRERQIAEGANLPHLAPAHCHLFRHTWATWAYACTRDLTYLMSHGGWKSASMVMRYTHVATDDLAEAVLAAGWEFGGRELPTTPKSRTKTRTSRR
ncbi:tyrosine-type recombinase/integrase [Phenylobacterium sp. VNQ135]|uniref:tyrosine-type recombinase/integrase n=1 Tax=Phenylobacterium sp. VNQ135 TaxID=3400922 RepID=UPI003BFBFC29